jgi:hypothetical protein
MVTDGWYDDLDIIETLGVFPSEEAAIKYGEEHLEEFKKKCSRNMIYEILKLTNINPL